MPAVDDSPKLSKTSSFTSNFQPIVPTTSASFFTATDGGIVGHNIGQASTFRSEEQLQGSLP